MTRVTHAGLPQTSLLAADQPSTLLRSQSLPASRAETAAQQARLTDRLVSLQRSSHSGVQQELQHLLAQSWLYQRTQQQSSHGSDFAALRRQQLAGIRGGEQIASQYGLHFAQEGVSPRAADLRQGSKIALRHPLDTDYVRVKPSTAQLDRCLALYHARGGQDDDNIIFVNSRHAAKQIVKQLCRDGKAPEHFTTTADYLNQHLTPLQPGLFALYLQDGLAIEDGQSYCEHFGGAPSLYATSGTDSGPVASDHAVDNIQLLQQLKPQQDGSVSAALRAIPTDHAMSALAGTAAALIDSLVATLEEKGLDQRHRHNPLLASGLQALHAVADSMPALSRNSGQFINAYNILMEEMQVCLSASRPYTLHDFHQAAASTGGHHLLPPALRQDSEVRLFSSGMAALSTGLNLCRKLAGSSKVDDLLKPSGEKIASYYETDIIRDYPQQASLLSRARTSLKAGLQMPRLSGGAFSATLHDSIPSQKGHRPDITVDTLVGAINSKLAAASRFSKPMVVMLDTTLEQRGEVDSLLHQLAKPLQQGKLRLILCKSLQKYANLGCGKAMGGTVALASVNDQAAQRARQSLQLAERDVNWMAGNEAQLLTHLLRQHEREFDLADHAKQNLDFVTRTCFHGMAGHAQFDAHDPAMPYAVLLRDDQSYHTLHLTHQSGEVKVDVGMAAYIDHNYVNPRAGFGYADTTISSAPLNGQTASRLFIGQESHAELTEAFYLAGRMMQQPHCQWGWPQARQLIDALVNEGLRQHPMASNRPSTLAQKLNHIGRQELPASTSAQPGMLAQRQQQETDQRSGFTLNKITSVINLLGSFTRKLSGPESWQRGPDRQLLDELLPPLIQSGLPGVSSLGRSSIMALHTFLCRADMISEDPAKQQAGLQRLLDASDRLPGLPQQVDGLLAIPEPVFAAADKATKEHVINTLLLPADMPTRLSVIGNLLARGKHQLAEHCLTAAEQSLDRGALKPETFSQTSTPGQIATLGQQERLDYLRQLAARRQP
ncbi:hypothetical protein C4K68_09220 [Pokkaliibacter plantistimulans]|uniref:Uncharacterized protein n=1 Tax=Proteobacteria bacterium 228 TaxID=2083153 RepID=A0A2S5KSY8_9PROT|nr:hypothetical protein [Pokkaliibacter plantistimulans]PPC77649.1 hypothetical protein C4K68_09220 [Pokkaliibacter plantistimulans]